jgi:isoamylase
LIVTTKTSFALPLGANFDGEGTNFSVFSEVADSVVLCLFDDENVEQKVELYPSPGGYWHAYVPHARPGQRYGYRVLGPYEPAQGLTCNPHKLLLDPYARAIEGRLTWHPSVFIFDEVPGGPASALDNAPYVPRSIVVDSRFDWEGDELPRHPLHEALIYELHVKGFTAQHPDVPKHLRGSYEGLAQPAVIEYLQKLGVSAVELLPVHQFEDDYYQHARGVVNFWGYGTIGYFAPHNGYSSSGQRGEQVLEFKRMVRALHKAGIEVILDVVYNHTGEGSQRGPTLCFRGLDNAVYYHQQATKPSEYQDYTGCGNSIAAHHPQPLQLILDSLRYWVQEMHVDGFRFDLATTLARSPHEYRRNSAFFSAVQQDPVLQKVKLIGEPWDLGDGGYQVGRFPPLWSEWNDRYRIGVREFWNGGSAGVGELARRLTGSADIYQPARRLPQASVNFVTAHDGFTLRDLVSYNEKHNEENREQNRDGDSHNRSWNCGVEGPTHDPEINALRARQQRNFLATLLLSQGVPMLLAGDELGRSQRGNNNAYCIDDPLTWVDWLNVDEALLAFTQKLIALRKRHPALRRSEWLHGLPVSFEGYKDIAWFMPGGEEFQNKDWDELGVRALCVYLNAHTRHLLEHPWLPDDDFLLVINAHPTAVEMVIPGVLGGHWQIELDTDARATASNGPLAAGSSIELCSRSLQVYTRSLRRASLPPPV